MFLYKTYIYRKISCIFIFVCVQNVGYKVFEVLKTVGFPLENVFFINSILKIVFLVILSGKCIFPLTFICSNNFSTYSSRHNSSVQLTKCNISGTQCCNHNLMLVGFISESVSQKCISLKNSVNVEKLRFPSFSPALNAALPLVKL